MQIVANVVGRCVRSTTGSNLRRIHLETGLDPWIEPYWKVRNKIMKAVIKSEDGYRVQYLKKLLQSRLNARA